MSMHILFIKDAMISGMEKKNARIHNQETRFESRKQIVRLRKKKGWATDRLLKGSEPPPCIAA